MYRKIAVLLPEEISDEAAYHLVNFFSDLNLAIDSRYYAQVKRYIRDSQPPDMPADWLDGK